MSAAYAIVWELRPRPGREEEFERAYGPEGDWARLFRRAEGYLGTELLRDPAGPGRYLTIDRWASRAAFAAFKRAHGAEYEALDRACEGLTERESSLGSFENIEPGGQSGPGSG
jgi:heme-degrading monooxygenase HmoA